MLNTHTNVSNTTNNAITFNSVAGTLVKSCQQSKFVRFHMTSEMATRVFDGKKPRISDYTKSGYSFGDDYKDQIQVLQVMLCGGDQFLVEFIELGEES